MKEIAPELDFLDIPFMFKNYDEVRKIYNKMGKEIAETFEKNGFILFRDVSSWICEIFFNKGNKQFL